MIFLIGRVFNKERNFSEISKLEKFNATNTKFIIFDNSEIGAVVKHAYSTPFAYSDNITFLDRKGIITIDDIKIAYLSGLEDEKYLVENNANSAFDFLNAIYTGNAFSREDFNELIKLKEETEKEAKIDILLSHSVPNVILQELFNTVNSPIFASLNNVSNTSEENDPKAKKPLLVSKEALEKHSSFACSLIAKKLSPRYHVVLACIMKTATAEAKYSQDLLILQM